MAMWLDEFRGWGSDWEKDVPRTAKNIKNRVSRIAALGNGQVPLCAATAWRILYERIMEDKYES